MFTLMYVLWNCAAVVVTTIKGETTEIIRKVNGTANCVKLFCGSRKYVLSCLVPAFWLRVLHTSED